MAFDAMLEWKNALFPGGIETKGRGTIMLGKPNNGAPAIEAFNEAL
jgi:hypothetical protein